MTLPLFDRVESERQKELGMSRAAYTRAALLEEARRIAVSIAEQKGQVHMDDVIRRMEFEGLPFENLGPAAGSVFKGKRFIFTGRWAKSERVSNHSSDLRIWRLRISTDPQ